MRAGDEGPLVGASVVSVPYARLMDLEARLAMEQSNPVTNCEGHLKCSKVAVPFCC